MKALRTPLITTALLAALAGSAFAQMGTGGMPGPDGQGPRAEKMRERMVERHTRHLNELKAKLKLEASQEAAWKTFADAMQPPAQAMARPERIAIEKMSTPERLDRMQAMHTERSAHMQKHADATRTFYAGLNAEQKKTFDAETARFMQGMGRQSMHGQHMHH
jgi:hypothetical protein